MAAPGDRRDGVGHAAGAVLGRVAGGAARDRHGGRFVADPAGRREAHDGVRSPAGPGQPPQARCGLGAAIRAMEPVHPDVPAAAGRGWTRPPGRRTGVRGIGGCGPGSPSGKRSFGRPAAGGRSRRDRCSPVRRRSVILGTSRTPRRASRPHRIDRLGRGRVTVGFPAGMGSWRSAPGGPPGGAGWPGPGRAGRGTTAVGAISTPAGFVRAHPSRGGAPDSPQAVRGARRLVAIGAIGAVVVLAVVLGITVSPRCARPGVDTASTTPTPTPTSSRHPGRTRCPASCRPRRNRWRTT